MITPSHSPFMRKYLDCPSHHIALDAGAFALLVASAKVALQQLKSVMKSTPKDLNSLHAIKLMGPSSVAVGLTSTFVVAYQEFTKDLK